MKEFILTIEFGIWKNQLWFMSEDTPENKDKWQKGMNEINSLKTSSKDALSFQDKVIESFKNLGFIQIQK